MTDVAKIVSDLKATLDKEEARNLIGLLGHAFDLQVQIVPDLPEGCENYGTLFEEPSEEYLCPDCGGQVTSGINHPEGDYKDWLLEPHCMDVIN